MPCIFLLQHGVSVKAQFHRCGRDVNHVVQQQRRRQEAGTCCSLGSLLKSSGSQMKVIKLNVIHS